MQVIHQAPLAALGLGAAFTVIWGVADPVAALAEVRVYTGVGTCARDAGAGEESGEGKGVAERQGTGGSVSCELHQGHEHPSGRQ